MANHQSALKRIRQNIVKRLANRYYKKTTRSAIKKLRSMDSQDEAKKFLPRVVQMIDKLAKNNSWHKNKAGNIKSSIMRHVAGIK